MNILLSNFYNVSTFKCLKTVFNKVFKYVIVKYVIKR